MADDNSTALEAPSALLTRYDLLNALLNIKGTVQLSRKAVYDTMNIGDLRDNAEQSAETLQAAEGALTLTEAAIEQLYEQIEAIDKLWPAPSEEVSDG